MVKKSENIGENISLGTDNWNVADGYTKLKILRQLVLLDRWDTISQFGTEEIDEDQNFNDNYIKKRRIEALQRLHSTLKQLLGNVLFALNKKDKEIIENHINRLKLIDEFMSKVYSFDEDNITHEEVLDINEALFKKILEKLQEVKDNINICLNNANLIFRASEEVDLDKIMEDIVQGG